MDGGRVRAEWARGEGRTAGKLSRVRQGAESPSAWLLPTLGKQRARRSLVSPDSSAAFFCRSCQRTVSLLPSFAQSYRLLNTGLIERFFLGLELRGPERRWEGLLERYWKRAPQFGRELVAVIGMGLGRAPPRGAIEVDALTRWLTRLCGGLGPATEQLVNRWAVSLFGPYRCYQRALS